MKRLGLGGNNKRKATKRKTHKRASKFGLALIWTSIFGRPTKKTASLRVQVEEKLLSLLKRRSKAADSVARLMLIFLPMLEDDEIEFLFVFLKQIKKPGVTDIIWGLTEVLRVRQRNGKKLSEREVAFLDYLSRFSFASGEVNDTVSTQMQSVPISNMIIPTQPYGPAQPTVQALPNQLSTNTMNTVQQDRSEKGNVIDTSAESQNQQQEEEPWDPQEWIKHNRHSIDEMPKHIVTLQDLIDHGYKKLGRTPVWYSSFDEVINAFQANDPDAPWKATFALYSYIPLIDYMDPGKFLQAFKRWYNYVKQKGLLKKPLVTNQDEFVEFFQKIRKDKDFSKYYKLDVPFRSDVF